MVSSERLHVCLTTFFIRGTRKNVPFNCWRLFLAKRYLVLMVYIFLDMLVESLPFFFNVIKAKLLLNILTGWSIFFQFEFNFWIIMDAFYSFCLLMSVLYALETIVTQKHVARIYYSFCFVVVQIKMIAKNVRISRIYSCSLEVLHSTNLCIQHFIFKWLSQVQITTIDTLKTLKRVLRYLYLY